MNGQRVFTQRIEAVCERMDLNRCSTAEVLKTVWKSTGCGEPNAEGDLVDHDTVLADTARAPMQRRFHRFDGMREGRPHAT